ncbi:MAG TPA: DUF418 domain-containing protein [Chitinophagaceae bacterium]
MSNKAIPVLQSERADILDVLRGFAILGILLDNIIGFTGWGFMLQATRESLSTWPADGLLGLFELTFIKGKFYSLFSLLFGIGFSIILIRNEQRGVNPLIIFYRRLSILLIFGAIHVFGLWEGDILFLYASVGLLLPLFRKCSDKTLLIWAAVLITSPILIDTIKVLFHFRTGAFLENIAMRIDDSNGIIGDSFRNYLYKEGSGWNEWRNWQESGFFWRYGYIIESNRIPKVFGMFLIGFWAGRKMIYANLENYISLFKKLRKWGFIIGVPASVACTYFEIDEKSVPNSIGLFDTITYALGVVPLSLAYVSSICLYWVKKKGDTKWKALAPVGRMALTNYLMQTVICVGIFYGVGLGLGGNIGPSVFFPVALGIYGLQILYSNLWFNYFNYGPLEWIWRMLTYGKRLKISKGKAV